MNSWFSWRTVLGSVVLAAAFTAGLFALAGRTFSLSGLDLFFAVTTVISLGFNLRQLVRDNHKYAPLKDSLIGLFNDLKGRQLRAHQRKLLITSVAGNALPREALQLEFYDFVDETTQSLEQLREHVVAAIHTLDPDASSQQVFRAAEFGQNEQEKRLKTEGMERFIKESAEAAERARVTKSATGAVGSSEQQGGDSRQGEA